MQSVVIELFHESRLVLQSFLVDAVQIENDEAMIVRSWVLIDVTGMSTDQLRCPDARPRVHDFCSR